MALAMRAAIYDVEAHLPELRNGPLHGGQSNKWSSRNPLLHKLLRRFWALCDLHGVRVQMDYVRSAENPADAPSRYRFSDEWKLSPEVFAAVEHQLCLTHSIDLFASAATTQLSRYVS